MAGLIVEDADLGADVIDDQQVAQTIAVEIRHVQIGDAEINRKNLRAGKAEAVGGGFVADADDRKQGQAGQRERSTVAQVFNLP